MTESKGKLVVISGPSGAGKTTVCRQLKKDDRVEFSISATTRARRPREVDGVDYHFLTEEEFLRRREAGEFLESAQYNGNYYGTLRAPMDAAIAAGRIFVLEIEVKGTKQLRDGGVEGDYIFIVPPSMEELRRRLVARGSNSDAEIEERMAITEEEMKAAELYDHIVPNAILDDAIAAVKQRIGL